MKAAHLRQPDSCLRSRLVSYYSQLTCRSTVPSRNARCYQTTRPSTFWSGLPPMHSHATRSKRFNIITMVASRCRDCGWMNMSMSEGWGLGRHRNISSAITGPGSGSQPARPGEARGLVPRFDHGSPGDSDCGNLLNEPSDFEARTKE